MNPFYSTWGSSASLRRVLFSNEKSLQSKQRRCYSGKVEERDEQPAGNGVTDRTDRATSRNRGGWVEETKRSMRMKNRTNNACIRQFFAETIVETRPRKGGGGAGCEKKRKEKKRKLVVKMCVDFICNEKGGECERRLCG